MMVVAEGELLGRSSEPAKQGSKRPETLGRIEGDRRGVKRALEIPGGREGEKVVGPPRTAW